MAGRLGVVLLPAFRDQKANEIHRIMLTVWKADPKLFEDLTAEAQVVLAEAQKWLGGHFFEKAWQHGPWVESMLQRTASLLASNDETLTVSRLPQLMIGGEILVGAPRLDTIRTRLDRNGADAARESEVTDSKPLAEVKPEVSKETGARLEFEKNTLNLPEVVKGEKGTGKFVFTNTGTDPLKILKIKASCGYTTVAGLEQTVLPGEKGSFEVALDSSRFVGKLSKSIDVTTNAGNGVNGVLKVTIQANVWSPVKMTRYSASFGTLIKGRPQKPMSIMLTVTDEDPLEISKPTSTNPAFAMDFKTLEVGRRYELVVSPPQIESGLEQVTITIPLGHPRLEKMEFPIYARVAEAVEVMPKTLPLWSTRGSAPSSRILTVSCHDRSLAKFLITDIKISGTEEITAKAKPVRSSRWAQIEVIVPAAFDSSTLQGKNVFVTLTTNHPEYPEIRVPVTAYTPSRAAPSPRSQ